MKTQRLKKIGKVGISLISSLLIIGSAGAVDSGADATKTTKAIIEANAGKEALNQALKFARSKPAMSLATSITCLACLPLAGVAASPGLCVACGILIAKTLG